MKMFTFVILLAAAVFCGYFAGSNIRYKNDLYQGLDAKYWAAQSMKYSKENQVLYDDLAKSNENLVNSLKASATTTSQNVAVQSSNNCQTIISKNGQYIGQSCGGELINQNGQQY